MTHRSEKSKKGLIFSIILKLILFALTIACIVIAILVPRLYILFWIAPVLAAIVGYPVAKGFFKYGDNQHEYSKYDYEIKQQGNTVKVSEVNKNTAFIKAIVAVLLGCIVGFFATPVLIVLDIVELAKRKKS